MRDKSMSVFDQNEEIVANLLCNIGLKRNMAKALVYLANVEESVSRSIELGAGLRQPEVSIAMRELRGRGWIDEWEQKKEGKGRPLKCYRLSVPLCDIIDTLEKSKKLEVQRDEESIAMLRTLSSSVGSKNPSTQ
ncbi:MAG: ArsR family transcriptional regulator [Euryarchaeota archaeon]|nr:ArsR family transcriptional regulator [Euryarchaeota archaeon]